MTISGNRNLSQDQKDGYPIEAAESQNFRKAFFIASHINKEKITAKIENGMLTIRLPKEYEPQGKSSLIEIG